MTTDCMTLAMILAMDKNRLIGSGDKLPWHLPDELQYFKRMTMGKPLIMGRRTHESIGRPLPGRRNIVVTRQEDWSREGIDVVHSLEQAITTASKHVNDTQEVMIIGGAELCKIAMPQTKKLYLTIIDHEFEGDVWLDSYIAEEWLELSREEKPADENRSYAYSTLVLERK